MKSSCRFSISLNIFSPSLLEKPRPFSLGNAHSKMGMSSPISFWWIFPPTPSSSCRRTRCSFLNTSLLKKHVKKNLCQNSNRKSCFASSYIQFLSRAVALMCWDGRQSDECCPQSIHMIHSRQQIVIQDVELFLLWKHRMQHRPCPHCTQLLD